MKSLEETAGGAKISLLVEESDAQAFQEIKAQALRLQAAQIALRNESRRAERLEIEKMLLLEEVLPRLLATSGPQVQIAGPATGVVIASGSASVQAQQTVYDLGPLRPLLDELLNRRENLALTQDQAAQLDESIRGVQEELQKGKPRFPVLSGGLKVVRDLVVGSLGNAVGTALATNTWQPLLDQLGHFVNLLGG